MPNIILPTHSPVSSSKLFTLNQKYDYPQWPVVIYVKRYFAALLSVSLIMQTERNIVEDVKFICIMMGRIVHAAVWR